MATISSGRYVAGITGHLCYGDIEQCYNSGAVTCSATGSADAGGIAGTVVDGSSASIVQNCYNTGSVTAKSGNSSGGILGSGKGVTMNNCYSSGAISSASQAGGLTGWCGNNTNTFNHCYSIQSPAIGDNEDAVSATDVTDLTTAEMKDSDSFNGWDFFSTWGIRADSTYPALRNIDNAPFAFNDTIYKEPTVSFSTLLANDYDYETLQANLTLKITDTSYCSVSGDQINLNLDSVSRNSFTIEYQVGESRPSKNDTLWGSKADLTVIVNTAPKLSKDTLLTNEDVSLTVALESLVNDKEDNVLSFSVLDSTSLGSLLLREDSLSYYPYADLNGLDSLQLIVNDGSLSDTSWVFIRVVPVKDFPVIIWDNPDDISYGTALNETQLNATTTVEGTFIYDPEAGTILNAGDNQELKVTFTPIDTANYETVIKTVSINVNKLIPVITWENPEAITYGDTLTGTQLNATADVSGTFVYKPSSGTVLNGGTRILTVFFTPGDTLNYTTAFGSTSLTVNKATPVIIWKNPDDIVYGTALDSVQLNATANVKGSFVYKPAAGTVLNAGSGEELKGTFTPKNVLNYEVVTQSVTINVKKAAPVITWENPEDIAYGTALSSVQLNATADVSGTFVYRPAEGTVLDAGSGQELKVTFISDDLSKYKIVTQSVTINVNKATPAITWENPDDIVYGTALSSVQLNATADVSGSFAYEPAEGTVLDAGSNQELKVTFTPEDASNYEVVSKTVLINVFVNDGVGTVDSPTLTIYPNPAGDVVYTSGFDGSATFKLYDLKGKLILTKEINADESVFIGNLKAGIYLIKIDNTDSVSLHKLIKE